MPEKGTAIPNLAEWAKVACANATPDTFALFEGIRITGFARVHNNGFEFPPEHAAALHIGSPALDLPWDLFWDIRVFSKDRETHAWRTGPGLWYGRPATSAGNHPIRRCYKLWGTKVIKQENGWDYWTEGSRGTGVWLPNLTPIPEIDLPDMLLVVDEVVEKNEKSGLALIVDAIVRGFEVKPNGR